MNQQGFTIIELLASMAIIAALVGISVYQYTAYKTRAYNITALSDFRNGLTGIDTYYDDNEVYPTCSGAACETAVSGLALSNGVFLSFVAAGNNDVVAVACHEKGTMNYTYPSLAGLVIQLPSTVCNGA